MNFGFLSFYMLFSFLYVTRHMIRDCSGFLNLVYKITLDFTNLISSQPLMDKYDMLFFIFTDVNFRYKIRSNFLILFLLYIYKILINSPSNIDYFFNLNLFNVENILDFRNFLSSKVETLTIVSTF
jgi:hypothetical protein